MNDRLVRELTSWLMKSGWVRDYEHARAESEGFANHYEASAPKRCDATTPFSPYQNLRCFDRLGHVGEHVW